VRDLDMGLVAAFMSNHQMLAVSGRPDWRVVSGGSQRYVDAFRHRFRGRLLLDSPVARVASAIDGVTLHVDGVAEHFDAAVLACHADQTLALLEHPTQAQREVLGALRYQPNRAVVHTDASLMPRRRRAWSSWNVRIGDTDAGCRVTYWMNRLQRIATPQPVFVSLNADVRDECVLAERSYAHPVFDAAAVAAQAALPGLQGVGGLYFAGAYARWGFHEDGFVAGRRAAQALADRENVRVAA
jgi:predicted NAD/FAD-binding protein